MSEKSLVEITQSYYDSTDADEFYFRIWGGEDIHIGIYDEGPDISYASQKTVKAMAAQLPALGPDTPVLDIGAGYGGAARYLAKAYTCPVTCLNLSQVENERNRQQNQAQGLAPHIEVVEGNFEALPFQREAFQVVWSEDALLHSDQRWKVFQEVDRVLAPGGDFIFTDPMQSDDCPPDVLDPVLARIHLSSMGSVAVYRAYAQKLGWKEAGIRQMPEHLVKHYSRVLEELERQEADLRRHCSPTYLQTMKRGLNHWISAGNAGYLNWGILHFRKPKQ